MHFARSGVLRRTLEVGVAALSLIAAAPEPSGAQSSTAGTASPAPGPVPITAEERRFLVSYLRDTERELAAAVAGMSEQQMAFKPSPDSWSMAEILEHIVVVERSTFGFVEALPRNTPFQPEWKGTNGPRVKDLGFIMAFTNRVHRKLTAPERFRPQHLFKSRDEALRAFRARRDSSVAFAETTQTDLRGHFAEIPVVGIVDAYQWFLFLGAHNERHFLQLMEVKAAAGFPK